MNEPIIAYRVWRVKDGLLTAAVWDQPWKPMQRVEASCLTPEAKGSLFMYGSSRRHIEKAPISSCDCGVYAFKDVDLVVDHIVDIEKCVVGRVALWGSVIECERGYKAEFAYPQVLYYTSDDEDQVRALARTYAIDAVPLPDHIMPLVEKRREEKAKGGEFGGLLASMVQSYYSYATGIGTWTIVPPKPNPPRPSDIIILDDPVDKGLSAKTAQHPFKTFIAENRKRRHHHG